MGIVAVALTSWPVAGISAAAATALFPRWFRRSDTPDQIEVIGALTTWIEMMRDVLQAGGLGLQTVIRETASDAPRAIRKDVEQLALDCEMGSLDAALDAFAARVAHPACDLVVRGLQIHGADRLADMLTSVATSLHMEADVHRRVDAQREPERLTVWAILGITVGCLLLTVLLSRSFLAPYGSTGGQLALAVILSIMGAGVWWSAKAARGEPPRRLLATSGTRRP